MALMQRQLEQSIQTYRNNKQTATMNDPHAHTTEEEGGGGPSRQSYATENTFYGSFSNAMSNARENDSHQRTEQQQPYLISSYAHPPQPQAMALPLLPQQQGVGFSTANPMMVPSSFAAPPNNILMSNQAAFYAYMQQPGTSNLVIPSFSNSFAVPMNGMNSTQFVGQTVQWPPGGDALTSVHNANGTGDSERGQQVEQQDQQNDVEDDDDENKVQSLRDRNRAHARSARQRKKAYVQELQSLVDSLHTERKEEMRQRMAATQRSVDVQKQRRRVMVTFLNYHSRYQTDPRKWSSILEESFWLKQPITPFRSFRRSEIENECRISRGVDAVIFDAASLSVMLESIGCYSSRWVRIKREKFLQLEESKRCPNKKKPSCIVRQDSRLLHAVSSLTCSSESLTHKEEEDQSGVNNHNNTTGSKDSNTNKVSSSSGGSGGSGSDGGSNGSNDPKNFHNKQSQDRKKSDGILNRADSLHTNESPGEDSSDVSFGGPSKRPISSDLSSSEYDSDLPLSLKRRKSDPHGYIAGTINLPTNISSNGEITHPTRFSSVRQHENKADLALKGRLLSQQPPAAINVNDHVSHGPHLIATDAGDGSSDSDNSMSPQIKGQYHFNDDDIMIMEDVSMCPFVFRSQNAVLCGALAECVMPGMLRARFSDRNKLLSVELVYDAMGFMQQLERASGNDVSTQIIPGSLDMALSPTTQEARVITLAQPPYLIVNVNEVWTRVTGFTQIESEGRGYLHMLEGEATVGDAKQRPGKPEHLFDRVAKGQPACSTNIHYDCNGRDFVEFVCSYPLANAADEVTHILHVSRELPSFDSPIETN